MTAWMIITLQSMYRFALYLLFYKSLRVLKVRSLLIKGGDMGTFLKYTGILIAVLSIIIATTYGWFSRAYPDVGPAPDIKVDMSDAQVEWGRYLFHNVAACSHCHSKRDWRKFGGPDTPGTIGQGEEKFEEAHGTVYAKNLTPYGLKDWTDGEIYRAITTGVDKYGNPLYPLMPYQSYSKMDSRDVKAIISYIRTLKPIAYDPPKRDLHRVMEIMLRTVPQPAQPIVRPDRSDITAYGKYLITIGDCSGCHTQVDEETMAFKTDLYLAGGWEVEMPGGTVGVANLTPDSATGLGYWSLEQFLNRFKNFDAHYDDIPPVTGNAFQTIMPVNDYAGMTTEDLTAIYTYLRTVKPVKNKVNKFTPRSLISKE